MDILNITNLLKKGDFISEICTIQRIIFMGNQLKKLYREIYTNVYQAYCAVRDIHGMDLLHGLWNDAEMKKKYDLKSLPSIDDAETKTLMGWLNPYIKFKYEIAKNNADWILNLTEIETEMDTFLKLYEESKTWNSIPLDKQSTLIGLFYSLNHFFDLHNDVSFELFETIQDEIKKTVPSPSSSHFIYWNTPRKYIESLCMFLKEIAVHPFETSEKIPENKPICAFLNLNPAQSWVVVPNTAIVYHPYFNYPDFHFPPPIYPVFHTETFPENTVHEITILYRNKPYPCGIRKQKISNFKDEEEDYFNIYLNNELQRVCTNLLHPFNSSEKPTILFIPTSRPDVYLMEIMPKIPLSMITEQFLSFIVKLTWKRNPRQSELIKLPVPRNNPDENYTRINENTLALPFDAFTPTSSYLYLPSEILTDFFGKNISTPPLTDKTTWELKFGNQLEWYVATLGYNPERKVAYLSFGEKDEEQDLLSSLRKINENTDTKPSAFLYLTRTNEPNTYHISLIPPENKEPVTVTHEKSDTDAIALYQYLRNLPRNPAPTYTTYSDGLFVVFESGERFGFFDRIVAIGMNSTAQSMKKRINGLFTGNKTLCGLRREIGTALLTYNRDPYLSVWQTGEYAGIDNASKCLKKEEEIESCITAYLQKKCTFSTISVPNSVLRAELYALLITKIASLYKRYPSCSSAWEGQYHPNPVIQNGLWNGTELPPNPSSKISSKLKQFIKTKMGISLQIPGTNIPGNQESEQTISTEKIRESKNKAVYTNDYVFSDTEISTSFAHRTYAVINHNLLVIDVPIDHFDTTKTLIIPPWVFSFFHRNCESAREDPFRFPLIYLDKSYPVYPALYTTNISISFSHDLYRKITIYRKEKESILPYLRFLFEKIDDGIIVLHLSQAKTSISQEKKDAKKRNTVQEFPTSTKNTGTDPLKKILTKKSVAEFGTLKTKEAGIPNRPFNLDPKLIAQANQELEAVTRMLAVTYEDVNQPAIIPDNTITKTIPESNDVWSSFISSLTPIQREYLQLLTAEKPTEETKLNQIIKTSGMPKIVFIDSINETAVEFTGDIVINDDGELIPEYRDLIVSALTT